MRIGIDLGGTKIEAIAIGDDGRERLRERVASPRGDYDATLDAVTQLVCDVERRIGERGTVGIGIPGTIVDHSGLVKNANSTWLNGRPLGIDLTARLDRPLRFDNDANCFALSEATDGGAAGAHVVFGVILGTGVGGGVIVNGSVVRGRNGIGGEWGHNPLPAMRDEERPGPRCYCGRDGCVETFLSGPALARDYALCAGAERTPQEIAASAVNGDAAAVACLERYEDRLARALGSVINLLDPDVIVLGGGVSNIARLYQTVPARWLPYIFSDVVTTKLVGARHGDSSGVRGAAWLWPQAHV